MFSVFGDASGVSRLQGSVGSDTSIPPRACGIVRGTSKLHCGVNYANCLCKLCGKAGFSAN